ncbi:MAG: hypothetical protein J5695_00645 [Bacteroidales bacterium]|nr:hypothetical protein [Bacteroidales bacterium]
MIICTTNPEAAPGGTVLEAYIEHKIGSSIRDIVADSPERFRIIEAEALRDLIVMSEVAGTDASVILGPHTLDNPDCRRLVNGHCSLIP